VSFWKPDSAHLIRRLSIPLSTTFPSHSLIALYTT